METLFDYLTWRGDLSFSKDPFNEIDSLILSLFSYLPMDEVVPKAPSEETITIEKAMKFFFKKHGTEAKDSGALLGKFPFILAEKLLHSHRFRHIPMTHFVNRIDKEKQEQFSAISFLLPKNLIYIVYKGTDDSIAGWQENLNMLRDFPVPAQKNALRYFQKMLGKYPHAKFILGGHSKGGNLAVYAATYVSSEEQKRIKKVYNHDGPGFDLAKFCIEKINPIQHKIVQIIPEDCVVGNLFDNPIHHRIIVKTTKRGIINHFGFYWQVSGKHFVTTNTLSKRSLAVDTSIKKLLSEFSLEERVTFLKELTDVIVSTNHETLTDMKKEIFATFIATRKMNSKNRRLLLSFLNIFLKNNAF